jgi:hypothetical protein
VPQTTPWRGGSRPPAGGRRTVGSGLPNRNRPCIEPFEVAIRLANGGTECHQRVAPELAFDPRYFPHPKPPPQLGQTLPGPAGTGVVCAEDGEQNDQSGPGGGGGGGGAPPPFSGAGGGPPRTPKGEPLYRGGSDLTPRVNVDVVVDKNTGLLRTSRGISLFDNPDSVRKFGGAYRIESIPEGLVIRQRGQNLSHYELMPAEPMTLERYLDLLSRVVTKLIQ